MKLIHMHARGGAESEHSRAQILKKSSCVLSNSWCPHNDEHRKTPGEWREERAQIEKEQRSLIKM